MDGAVTAGDQLLPTPDRLGAAGSSELVESTGTVRFDGVFGNEKLRGDLPIAHSAGDEGEDFEFARCDAKVLLLRCIGGKRFGGAGLRGNMHFFHYDGFATTGDAETEPDAEGREENGDQRAVKLYGMFDDDKAVFGVLEGADEETTDDSEDEDVAPHDGDVKKYNKNSEGLHRQN